MNTPAHLLINFGLLAKKQPTSVLIAVGIGALLPDLPMIIFYLYEKAINVPEAIIWGEHYYLPKWQNVFDAFNSIPIAALMCLIAYRMKCTWLLFLSASMLLHFALDLPLHHDDGHRHFFPLSDWRFASPLSYWDPAHYGGIVMACEAILSLVAAVYIWMKNPALLQRGIVAISVAVYLLFLALAAHHWGG